MFGGGQVNVQRGGELEESKLGFLEYFRSCRHRFVDVGVVVEEDVRSLEGEMVYFIAAGNNRLKSG